jgi:hypothetical protein
MIFVVNAAAAVAAPALIILRRVGEAMLPFGLVLRGIISIFFIGLILFVFYRGDFIYFVGRKLKGSCFLGMVSVVGSGRAGVVR